MDGLAPFFADYPVTVFCSAASLPVIAGVAESDSSRITAGLRRREGDGPLPRSSARIAGTTLRLPPGCAG